MSKEKITISGGGVISVKDFISLVLFRKVRKSMFHFLAFKYKSHFLIYGIYYFSLSTANPMILFRDASILW